MADSGRFAGRVVIGRDLRYQETGARRRTIDDTDPHGLDSTVCQRNAKHDFAFGRRENRDTNFGMLIGQCLDTLQIGAFTRLRMIVEIPKRYHGQDSEAAWQTRSTPCGEGNTFRKGRLTNRELALAAVEIG